jgi:glycosyltransferase involved in cell wall biosynthesis
MGRQPDRVDILLATFNGEQFIERQIESVLDQMDSGHRLLIRDDGSSDGTVSIVRRFADRRSNRIVLLEDKGPQLGACRSFGRLLEHSDADYILLCDQDDVWLPGRIARPLERIQEVEREHGSNRPVLAHTDLVVVDENLDTIAPSFWSYSHLRPECGSGLNRLLVQNVVTGCATMMNRALARLACPIPSAAAPMHDWWLALVASALGQIETIPEATVLYRQHRGNCLGATRYNWRYVLGRVQEVLLGGGVSKRLQVSQRQARTFLRRFAPRLDSGRRELLRDFLSLTSVNSLCRRRLMMKHHFFGSGRLRNLAWLAMI